MFKKGVDFLLSHRDNVAGAIFLGGLACGVLHIGFRTRVPDGVFLSLVKECIIVLFWSIPSRVIAGFASKLMSEALRRRGIEWRDDLSIEEFVKVIFLGILIGEGIRILLWIFS